MINLGNRTCAGDSLEILWKRFERGEGGGRSGRGEEGRRREEDDFNMNDR